MNPPNLLDEALGLGGGRRVILVEDCVETSGAFVLHHLIKRSLSSSSSPAGGGGTLVFVALAQPFSHYDRIMRKMGCNLAIQRENKRLHFIDMLKLKLQAEYKGEIGRNVIENGLAELYAKIQRTVEVSSFKEQGKGCITIMIDDLSLLEIAAHGSGDHVLDFLRYCITLTSEQDCSLVILNHEDIYSSDEAPRFLLNLEHLSDVIIKTEPLTTGLAADVHGQLTITRKGISNKHWYSANKISNFHFRVKENAVEYFYPGSQH